MLSRPDRLLDTALQGIYLDLGWSKKLRCPENISGIGFFDSVGLPQSGVADPLFGWKRGSQVVFCVEKGVAKSLLRVEKELPSCAVASGKGVVKSRCCGWKRGCQIMLL